MADPERTPWTDRARSIVRAMADPDALTLAAILLSLAYAVYLSASWRMRHDLPMMMYQAFAMNEFGLVPYRDFFDMNMPGTYLTYRLIGRVFGYSDTAVRLADWSWIAALWVVSLGFLRSLPRRVVVGGLALFTLTYLRGGGGLTLQREFLALPIIVAGLWGATLPIAVRWRALLVGLAFGVAATFKPHLLIAVLAPVGYLAVEARDVTPPGQRGRAIAGGVAWGTLGVAVPLGSVAIWLTARSLWEPFLHSLQYLVYYGQLDVAHEAVPTDERPAYLIDETLKLGLYPGTMMAGAFGAYLGLTGARLEPTAARVLRLLLALGLCFLIYPAGSGQFWNYHWLPLLYVALVCMGFLLEPPATIPVLARWMVRAVLLLTFLGTIDAGDLMHAYRARPQLVPADGRPDRIAKFLSKTMEPGDTVQPFDWVTGGAVHGMLLARARPATPYVYTFHFYHHVSTPYIQMLRTDFMEHLEAAKPAFVVESRGKWPFVTGPGTSTSFKAYEAWLAANYVEAHTSSKLIIWERTDHLVARGGTPASMECEEDEDWVAGECSTRRKDSTGVWSAVEAAVGSGSADEEEEEGFEGWGERPDNDDEERSEKDDE